MKRRQPTWTVDLGAVAHKRLTDLAEDALPNETGGLLVGWYNGTELHVADALAVCDPEAGPTSYVRTNQAGNATLQDHLEAKSPGDPSGYIGEWHSHPANAGPSPLDKLTFLNLAAQVRSPLAMVVLVRRDSSWEPTIHVVGPTRRPWRRTRGTP